MHLPDFDYNTVYQGPRRCICADIIKGWGSGGQLCPALLHPGCQSNLLPSSRPLRRSALHLSARLLCKLHTQPVSKNTPVRLFLLVLLCQSVIKSSRCDYITTVRKNKSNMCVFQESGEKPGETGGSHSRGLLVIRFFSSTVTVESFLGSDTAKILNLYWLVLLKYQELLFFLFKCKIMLNIVKSFSICNFKMHVIVCMRYAVL